MCFFLMSTLLNVLLQLVKRHQFIALVANFLGLIQVILHIMGNNKHFFTVIL